MSPTEKTISSGKTYADLSWTNVAGDTYLAYQAERAHTSGEAEC